MRALEAAIERVNRAMVGRLLNGRPLNSAIALIAQLKLGVGRDLNGWAE